MVPSSRKLSNLIVLSKIIFISLLTRASALKVEGQVLTTNSYALLERFVYTTGNEAVSFTYEFIVPNNPELINSLSLLVFPSETFREAWEPTRSCVDKWNFANEAKLYKTTCRSKNEFSDSTVCGNTLSFRVNGGGGESYKLDDTDDIFDRNGNKTARTVRISGSQTLFNDETQYFFFVLVSCRPDPPKYCSDLICGGSLNGIEYVLDLQNNGANPIYKYFSWDKDWNMVTSIIGLAFQLAVTGIAGFATFRLNKMGKFHHTVSLFNTAIAAQTSAMLFSVIGYSIFVGNGGIVLSAPTTSVIISLSSTLILSFVTAIGIGMLSKVHPVTMGLFGSMLWPFFSFLGSWLLGSTLKDFLFRSNDPISQQVTDLFDFTARMYFFFADFYLLLVVMLLAYGWTVVRRKLKAQTRFQLVCALVFYWALLMAALVWKEVTWNKATSFSIWETGPGYLIIAARIIAYLWFVGTTGSTLLRFNAKKKNFYGLFFIAYSVWLVALPIAVLVTSNFLPLALREKLAFVINMVVGFGAQLLLACLYLPDLKCTRKCFPFHATVGQVDYEEVFKEKTTLDSDEEEEGDGGGSHILEGLVSDKILNKVLTAEDQIKKAKDGFEQQIKDVQKRIADEVEDGINTLSREADEIVAQMKGEKIEMAKKLKPALSKLLPTNSKAPAEQKKKKDPLRKGCRVVSSVLGDNVTQRVDQRLDSVLFRMDRLLITVSATRRIVTRIRKGDNVDELKTKKSPERAESNSEKDESENPTSRPSKSLSAAARWERAKQIRSQGKAASSFRAAADESQSRRGMNRPRRQRVVKIEAESSEVADEESKMIQKESTSTRSRRKRRTKERTPEEQAAREERKRRHKEKKRKKREREKRRSRRSRSTKEDEIVET